MIKIVEFSMVNNSIEFVRSLKVLLPKAENLPSIIKKNYLLNHKNNSKLNENIIVDLINNVDSTYIQFGDFGFNDQVIEDGNFLIFAESSATYLAIDKSYNFEIVEIDKFSSVELNSVAISSKAFLNAFLKIMEMYSYYFENNTNSLPQEYSENILNSCIRLAGGEAYRQFYSDLIC